MKKPAFEYDEIEESGVRPGLPQSRARKLVDRWSKLQPRAHSEPAVARALRLEVVELLEQCMATLMTAGAGPEPVWQAFDCDQLMDASYVLERLEWCILHNAPYVDRPSRSALA